MFAVVLGVSCVASLRSQTSQIPSDWVKTDVDFFSFYAPPDMRNKNAGGTDSAFWEFRNRAMTLRVDYGMYSDNLESYSDRAEYHGEWIRIDGKNAKVVTLRTNDAEGPDKDRKYATAVYFPQTVGSATKLIIWAHCVDVATRDSARKIFLSIRFK